MDTEDIDSQFAEKIIGILEQAGQAIMKIYTDGNFEIEYKSPDSPLTKADRAAHELIKKSLHALTPQIPVVSEEDKDQSHHEGQYWLVDPLDGTKEFIKQNGEFSVMVALMQDEHPVFGAIYAPVLETTYYGASSGGAFKVKNGKKTQIHVRDSLNSPLVAVASRSHMDEKTQQFLNALGKHELTNIGSGLKFCLVAEGSADAYIRFHPTMEWDTAAGQAILEAAGGALISTDTTPFEYGKKGRVNGGFIAYNPLLQAEQYLN